MNQPELPRLDRRAAIKWMLAATATVAVTELTMFGAPASAAAPATKGYGTDPLLNKEYAPGDFWPLTMTEHQRHTAAVLCGLIIPAEGSVPSAADLKVHDFIDEWISSPYPEQKGDRETVLSRPGLDRPRGERPVRRELRRPQPRPDERHRRRHLPRPRRQARARRGGRNFSPSSRDLTASGFFTTPEGMKDIGYVGNMPLAEFKGPPPEVLKKLGLA